jgi:iron complex outermembrane receptor protein
MNEIQGKFRLHGASALLASAAVFCLAAPVRAQPAAAPAAVEGTLEEVIVTAQRREERLQTVPLAAHAFNEQQLETHHIEDATDLSKIVPSLSAAESSRDEENYVIRGMSGSGASLSGQQVAVPTYFSEVPLPIGDGGGPGRYFDLQNVQVLNGPQGTLFGRNSTGGAVLFEPKHPTDDFEGYAQLQFGNYSDVGYEAAINVPIVPDKLMVRAAGTFEQRDGYTKNLTTGQDQDDRDYTSERLSVLFRPIDGLENLTVVDRYDSHTNGGSNHLANINPFATVPKLLGASLVNALAAQQAVGPYETYSDVQGLDKIEATGVANITTWDPLENLTFRNIFGWRSFKQLNRFDYDGTALKILDFDTCSSPATCHTRSPGDAWSTNVEQYTEEPQIQGKLFGDRLQYTVGYFYLHADSPGSSYQHQTSVFGSVTDVNNFLVDDSRAGYFQFTYGLDDYIPGLKFTGGYRFTNDTRSLTVSQIANFKCTTGATGTLAPSPGTTTVCDRSLTLNTDTDSYTVGAEYQVTPDMMLYVTHRQGYRAGGLNPLAAPTLTANPPIPNASSLFVYQPEIARDTEIGVKSDWRFNGMSLRANVDAYNLDLDNAQLNQSFSVVSTSGVVSTVSALTNAGTANVKGIEADFTFIPVKPLTLTASYAYTDATYSAFLDYTHLVNGSPSLSSGRVFPFAPRNKFNISARYELPLDEAYGNLSATLSWVHKSSVILALAPTIIVAGRTITDPFGTQGDTDVLDLSFDWTKIWGSDFDGRFFITNLTDTVYRIGGGYLYSSLGTDQVIYNEPRMIGVQIRYSFGG